MDLGEQKDAQVEEHYLKHSDMYKLALLIAYFLYKFDDKTFKSYVY